jgi:hypothetical protein
MLQQEQSISHDVEILIFYFFSRVEVLIFNESNLFSDVTL